MHTGILTRRRYHLRDNAIIFPDLRQNLLMKIFGMVSLHIRCPGYGSRRDTLPVLIPLIRKKAHRHYWKSCTRCLVMEHPETSCTLQYPVFLVLCVPPVIGLCAILPAPVYPAVAAAESGGDHSLLFRDADYSAGVAAVYPHCGDVHGIGHHGRPAFADAFCSWFTFHTITVNHARIVRTDLMQTPAQKMYGVCHLYITCNGPRQQRFKLTALPEAKAREIVETLARTEMQDMS